MKRRIISLLFLVSILISLAITAVAAMAPNDTATPYYNNTVSTSTNFVISTTGKATISAVYNGHKTLTTQAVVTSYIEKRTLGLFWSKVDIGQPNNEWVDSSTEYADIFGHEFYLSDKGTYRATVTYEISGTGGATDVIEYEQQRTWS